MKEMELDDKRIPSTLFAPAERSSPDEIEAQHEKVAFSFLFAMQVAV